MLLELEGLDASRIDTLNKLLAGKNRLYQGPTTKEEFFLKQQPLVD
ncbi:unnamed protein product [Prunus brigantina]